MDRLEITSNIDYFFFKKKVIAYFYFFGFSCFRQGIPYSYFSGLPCFSVAYSKKVDAQGYRI